MNIHLTLAIILLSLGIIAPRQAGCQTKAITCADIKTGVFYFYPKNSTDRFVSTRDDKQVIEKNTVKGDSTIWEITWNSDCEYSLKYLSGNAKMPDDTKAFFQKHKLVYQISNVTPEYYTFTGYVDKIKNNPIQADTIWLNERVNIPDNRLFKNIPNPAVLRKERFSDTSKYAVLYVYRPGKLTNSLGSYLIYFDDNIMCVAKNRSGYIFKIFKEGQFTIKSRLYKDESSTMLDVKFGKTYYVKSMIHWTISSRLYNFKLEMKVMNPEDGQNEFGDVDLQ
jgi:hypothetical protein